jgi:hypothetical protein
MCTTKFEWWREYEHLFCILTYGSPTEGVKDKEEE